MFGDSGAVHLSNKLDKFAIDLRTGAILSGVLSLFAFLILFDSGNYHLVGNQQGYSPVQPIAFSHRVHAGDNQIPCLYCHSEAEKSATAGFPSANVCMNCHSQIKKESEEVQKISVAIRDRQPIQWVRVHGLGDFIRFNHSAHYTVGVTCQTCHGIIELETRVRQFATLGMGWCVNCHRQYTENPPPGLKVTTVNAGTDCTTCHY